MGAVLVATAVALVILGLLSLVDLSARPPRSSGWRTLTTALFFLGAAALAVTELVPLLGVGLGVLGTLAIGAAAGRPTAALLAPAYFAGALIVLTVFERDGVNYSYWFALAIGAPVVVAFTAALLAIAGSLRVLRGRRR